jgi:hypothetical protein
MSVVIPLLLNGVDISDGDDDTVVVGRVIAASVILRTITDVSLAWPHMSTASRYRIRLTSVEASESRTIEVFWTSKDGLSSS